MQKVVCVVCGLANLESFPTYPLCAGCGARLPEIKRHPLRDFFARPVKTLVWAFCMGAGVATLALLSTGIARETRLRERGQLVVASSLDSDMETGGANLLLQLRPLTSAPGDSEDMRNLRLRFDKRDAREAAIQILSPPATVRESGNGRYYEWARFPPGQLIRIRLRPKRLLKLDVAANSFSPFKLEISPLKSALPPVDLSPNRSN